MYKAEKVKIDVDYVNRFLEKKHITKKDFSEMNGHSRGWWESIKRSCDSMVAVNQAKLICTLTGLDYEKLVIQERPAIQQDEKKNILTEDENLLKALVNCLNRIEKKVDEATIDMTRMEIQMRTILKELGVK